MKMYMVGGAVRDKILGVPSKDIDFSVVLDQEEDIGRVGNDPFKVMVFQLKKMGFKIFLETPEHLTVRAQFPKELTAENFTVPVSVFQMRNGLTADFVLARKEGEYTDGRRPDHVEPGTLEDDLARRDFTMNAIAEGVGGSLIDPFNGRKDIADGIIRCVGDPFVRLSEDALRAVRALRFSVTKGFRIESDTAGMLQAAAVLDSIVNKISDERIQVELSKMFRYDTVASLKVLSNYPRLTEAMFSGNVSLDATLKTRGRGK